MKSLRRALVYLRPYFWTGLGAFVSMLLVITANLVAPQLLRRLVDQGIGRLDIRVVWEVAVLLVIVALGRGIFNFLQGYWGEAASQGAAYELRNAIFEKLQRLSFSYHDRAQTGNLMTRMTSDVELVRSFVGSGLLQLIGAMISFGATLLVLLIMNWRLSLVFLIITPLLGVVFVLFIHGVTPRSRAVQEQLSRLNTILQENLVGIRIIKAFTREDFEKKRYSDNNQELLSENIRLMRAFSTYFPLIFFIANLGIVGVLWAGGNLVLNQQMTVGDLVAFISYQAFLLQPVLSMGAIGTVMARAGVSADRVFAVIDAELEIQDRPGAVRMGAIQGKVDFEHVFFRYAGADEDVVRDISFSVQPGQTVAILGKTGAGKSSIINLIPRFYQPTAGRILVDGQDIQNVTLDSLRGQIGLVLQETTLFSGTIRENIAYGQPAAALDRIVQAAKAAQIDEFIRTLPEGYESQIGERGIGLSGGQKQRIAIARALLVEPRILIMDDGASAVDSEMETLIQAALARLSTGRTTFVIAQRLQTVRSADLILILEDGQLVGMGRHPELMETNEIYASILQTQFGDQAELEASLEAILQ